MVNATDAKGFFENVQFTEVRVKFTEVTFDITELRLGLGVLVCIV